MKEDSIQLDLMSVIGNNTGKTNEDEEFEKTEIKDDQCPYTTCDGSGFIVQKNDNGAPRAVLCQCHKDKVLKQKLINSNISEEFLHLGFSFDDGNTIVNKLKPLKEPLEFKTRKKSKTIEEALLEEDANSYIKRHFTVSVEERMPGELFESFSKVNLDRMKKKLKPANLLLFGDPGNGKTTFSTLIGKYFLENDKKVYFTTTEKFLNSIFSKKVDTIDIASKYDVLILDEFFNEYHTDTQWAKKKIKEILKIRESKKLITICTSNGNPKDFSLLYGESIMSLLKGTFFLFNLERKVDGRVEEMHNLYEDFGF